MGNKIRFYAERVQRVHLRELSEAEAHFIHDAFEDAFEQYNSETKEYRISEDTITVAEEMLERRGELNNKTAKEILSWLRTALAEAKEGEFTLTVEMSGA